MEYFIFILGCIIAGLRAQSSNPSDWSAAEVSRTKSKLWTIFKNPKKYVMWNKTPNPKKDCGMDCWDGCDDFK